MYAFRRSSVRYAQWSLRLSPNATFFNSEEPLMYSKYLLMRSLAGVFALILVSSASALAGPDPKGNLTKAIEPMQMMYAELKLDNGKEDKSIDWVYVKEEADKARGFIEAAIKDLDDPAYELYSEARRDAAEARENLEKTLSKVAAKSRAESLSYLDDTFKSIKEAKRTL